MISSPPEEAEQIRGKTLTPESPKPIYYPSPSNIPILEKQMDPSLGDPALSIGTPASYQSYSQQTHTPSASSTTPYYADQQSAPNFQNAATPGSVGAPSAVHSQPPAFNGAMGAQTQDTSSIPHYAAPQPAHPSYSDANAAPAQDTPSAYPYAYDTSVYAAQPPQAQSAQGDQSVPPPFAATVDVQALLDKLSTPANNGVASQYALPPISSQPAPSQGATPASSLPAAPNLPPRPPPQEKPTTHPNYNPNDDIRSYHPHSSHRGSTQLPSLNIRGGAGGTDQANSRANLSPSTPGYSQRQAGDQGRGGSPGDDEDQRWPPEVNKMYEDFLDEERRFVTEGQWEKFPDGSRLFIGNLPTEKVTKRDIFHRFYRHGHLAQISIKQAYGFVQFLTSEACAKALQTEQGQAVRGRKMHLEVSKPQRNTKKADPERNSGARRRSRSPDYSRGGSGPTPRNDQYGRNQNVMSPRDRDNRRYRDDFRRSPSPRGGRGYRGRDRSRDRYDQRRRSRSRSPRRYRSPSPRRSPPDGLPLPLRESHEVPDVQVLVVHQGLPRDFIRWVEDTFRGAGLRIDVLVMSPRLNEDAVIQRQIREGVLAIIRLDTAALTKGKINVQIFDRRGGTGRDVPWNAYADLDPSTAAALVANARQSSYQPVQPPAPAPAPMPAPYGQQYSAPPPANPYGPPTPTGATNPTNPANISSLIASLDPNRLSQLLGSLPGNSAAQLPHQAQAPSAGLPPELARLLSSVSTPAQAPGFSAPQQQQPPQAYPNPYQNPALAQLLGGQTAQSTAPPVQHPPQAAPPGQPDMKEIMAQLARYQR